MTSEEYCKREGEILSPLPPEFHGALSSMAYQSGHAYGYEEVLIHLEDFVTGLQMSIEEFERRIKRTADIRKQSG